MRWLIVILIAGCHHAPRGALGLHWGDDVSSLPCTNPRAHDRFQECDGGTVSLLGRHPHVVMVTLGKKLQGVAFTFDVTDCADLQAVVGKAYDVEYTPNERASPYTVFADNEVVHYDRCELVVAGPAYGKFYEDELLATGFRDLGRGFLVH